MGIKLNAGYVGSSVWVLHRSSGRFWRASVGEFCDGSDCSSVHMDTSRHTKARVGRICFKGFLNVTTWPLRTTFKPIWILAMMNRGN